MIFWILLIVAALLMGKAYFRFSKAVAGTFLNMVVDDENFGKKGGEEKEKDSEMFSHFIDDYRFTYIDSEENSGEEEKEYDLCVFCKKV